MNRPSATTVAAWSKLLRVEQALLARVEADLKTAGFPPLVWYDALLELSRAPDGRLRPLELERAMLLPQYSTSRLIERLVKAGYVARKTCPIDGRGQFVQITTSGRGIREKMWPCYAAAIERHLGAKLNKDDVTQFDSLLEKLI